MHQALRARDDTAAAEEAEREAEARVDEQFRHEQAERDRRRRLVELRTSLPADMLESLRRRAEEALANDGTDRTRLGYDVLVKMKMDELLERESLRMAVEDDQVSLKGVATGPRTGEASVRSTSGTRGE
jgi:hypothetical protein